MPPYCYERERVHPAPSTYESKVKYATNNKKRTRARRTNVKYLSR